MTMAQSTPSVYLAPTLMPDGSIRWEECKSYDEALAACRTYERAAGALTARLLDRQGGEPAGWMDALKPDLG